MSYKHQFAPPRLFGEDGVDDHYPIAPLLGPDNSARVSQTPFPPQGTNFQHGSEHYQQMGMGAPSFDMPSMQPSQTNGVGQGHSFGNVPPGQLGPVIRLDGRRFPLADFVPRQLQASGYDVPAQSAQATQGAGFTIGTQEADIYNLEAELAKALNDPGVPQNPGFGSLMPSGTPHPALPVSANGMGYQSQPQPQLQPQNSYYAAAYRAMQGNAFGRAFVLGASGGFGAGISAPAPVLAPSPNPVATLGRHSQPHGQGSGVSRSASAAASKSTLTEASGVRKSGSKTREYRRKRHQIAVANNTVGKGNGRSVFNAVDIKDLQATMLEPPPKSDKWECPHCGQGSTDRKRHLTAHLRQCTLCNPEDRFASSADLGRHMIRVHGSPCPWKFIHGCKFHSKDPDKDPDTQIQHVLGHCILPPQPAAAAAHKTRKASKASKAAKVAKPSRKHP